MIHVLLVDDHPLFAEGLRNLFKSNTEIKIVHHTTDGAEVPLFLSKEAIDLILMDIDMPNLDGIATMKLLRQQHYDVPVLILTMHQSMTQVSRALENGAQGYILKDADKVDLITAIRETSQRRNYFHPKVSEHVYDYFRGQRSGAVRNVNLSDREKEIIRCLANGMNTKGVSEILAISEHTVKTHRRNIMHKLAVRTSAELIRVATDLGIL